MMGGGGTVHKRKGSGLGGLLELCPPGSADA